MIPALSTVHAAVVALSLTAPPATTFRVFSAVQIDAGAPDHRAAPSGADDAGDVVRQGETHYAAGEFPEAAAAFARAHELDPQPGYLYRWAQAERRAGNCPTAIALYRKYLEHELPPENAEAARKNLARCGYVDEADPPAPRPTASVPPSRDPSAPSPAPRPDPAAIVLAVGGGAVLATSATLGAVSEAHEQRARDALVEADYARHAKRSENLRTAAIVTAAVGGALLIGAGIRWLVLRRRSGRTPSERLSARIRF